MSMIETEALELTGLKPKSKEPRQTFLDRLWKACDVLFQSDDEGSEEKADENWEKASDELQRWYKAGVKAYEKKPKEDVPEFPDVEAKEAEDEPDKDTDETEDTDEEETETQAEDAESEPADNDKEDEEMATKKKKGKTKGKTATNGAKKTAKTKTTKAAKAKATKAEKPAKKKKTRVAKGNGEAFKKVGVMAEIKRMLQRPDGASIKEIIAQLAKKFPERNEESMAISARAFCYVAGPKELGKPLKKKKDVEKRGTVFWYPASA